MSTVDLFYLLGSNDNDDEVTPPVAPPAYNCAAHSSKWDRTKEYLVGDYIYMSSKLYECIHSVEGIHPFESEYSHIFWKELVGVPCPDATPVPVPPVAPTPTPVPNGVVYVACTGLEYATCE